MKLEKMRKKNKLILILFLIFNIIHIKIVNAVEKNYIVAVVDNEPITFIDIKEKAKFIWRRLVCIAKGTAGLWTPAHPSCCIG